MEQSKKWSPLMLLGILILSIGMHFKQPSQRPNIIFIIGDDISAEDIGAYGNKAIRTPNIDNLAKNGLKFDRMFLTASSCSPSRSSILTGRYPHNTGAAELHTQLPEDQTYFPELLKKVAIIQPW